MVVRWAANAIGIALCLYAVALFACLIGCTLLAARAAVVRVGQGINALAVATVLPGGALDAAVASATVFALALVACLSGWAGVTASPAVLRVAVGINALAVATVRLVGWAINAAAASALILALALDALLVGAATHLLV